MLTAIQQDLNRNKDRLDYYTRLKSAGLGNNVEKWIAIYEERVEKLAREAQRLAKKATQARNSRLH